MRGWSRFTRRAKGGGIIARKDRGPTVVLSPGMAVLPDSAMETFTQAEIDVINGGETVVLSASEALRQLDEDDRR